MYSSALSLTSALDDGRGGWLTPRPDRFTHGKETRCPLYRRLGEPQGRSGRVRKISPPLGFDPRTVQVLRSGLLRKAGNVRYSRVQMTGCLYTEGFYVILF
jgi:hypothetical protein